MPADLTVRDRLFLLAHDEDHGFRPRLQDRALATGLAGAVLIDLIHAHRVHVTGDRIVISDLHDTSLVGDPIADQALTTIRTPARLAIGRHTQPPTVRPPLPTIRDLLSELAGGLVDRTRGALIAAGLIVHDTGLFGRHRYRPAHQHIPIRAKGAARVAAAEPHPVDEITDGLCGLLHVLRLGEALYLGDGVAVDAGLRAAAGRLRHAEPPYHGIPTVVTAVDAVVGDITVSVYR